MRAVLQLEVALPNVNVSPLSGVLGFQFYVGIEWEMSMVWVWAWVYNGVENGLSHGICFQCCYDRDIVWSSKFGLSGVGRSYCYGPA